MFAYYRGQKNAFPPFVRGNSETRKQHNDEQQAAGSQNREDTRCVPTKIDDKMRPIDEPVTRLGGQQDATHREEETVETNHLHKKNHRMQPEVEKPKSSANRTRVRTNNQRPTAQARTTKWFDPQFWWHSATLATCLLLLLCTLTAVDCEEQSLAIASTSSGGSDQQPVQQQQIEVEATQSADKVQASGESGNSPTAVQSSPDDTQQKVSVEETLSAPAASETGQDASATKSAETAPSNSEQSADTSQQASDSSSATAAATNSPAPSDLDSAAATATNLQQQQQQATIQQQLEEIPASAPTPQDVQDAQPQQQQVSGASNDQQQQLEQQTRATSSNYENDLLPVSQYGAEPSFGNKKQHASDPSSSQRARDSSASSGKTSRSLKRAFGGAAHMGVFGRKRTNQLARHRQQQQQQDPQQEQLTTTTTQAESANVNVERAKPAKAKAHHHHHHYYYQTLQQQQQQEQPTSGKQRQQLKHADYPDYKEILVQPDNLGDREYEERQQVGADVARQSQQTATSVPDQPQTTTIITSTNNRFEQDKVSMSDSDGPTSDTAPTTTATSIEQQQITTSFADHSGFEVQQQQQPLTGGSSGETSFSAQKDNTQMPYIRLSNIATISSTTSGANSSSSAGHAAGAGEMKLMRIYVIDLDQKLVVGGGGGSGSGAQSTYSPMASILDGATTVAAAAAGTPAPGKTNSEQQVSEQVVEQVKIDADNLNEQQHPYNENAAQLMQTQQSSTVYATTGVPSVAGEPDSTVPATESNLSLAEPAQQHNYTSDIGSHGRGPHMPAGVPNYTHPEYAQVSNYSGLPPPPQHAQQVVVVSDDYQKYAQQMGGAPGKLSKEFVYVDRDSLQANLSQIMAQMAHSSYAQPAPAAQAAGSSVGHFDHYPNHMLMTMSHHQQPQNYTAPLVSAPHSQPLQSQYYASNHQQVNYGPPPSLSSPELVYVNLNNGTHSHHDQYTNHRNQYLGKSARAVGPSAAVAAEPTTTQANYNWSQPAEQLSQQYQLQSLSVAYPSFVQQHHQQQQQQQAAVVGGSGGQFAAVYPAMAPMQHHQAAHQQPLVMSVPQYIAPQYATAAAAARPAVAQNYSAGSKSVAGPAHDPATTGGHAMIVAHQQPPTVSIYKQQQQQQVAHDGEQYSAPVPLPVEWQTAEGHPSSSSSSSSLPGGSAYNTQQQQQQQQQVLANDTNYKPQSHFVGPDQATAADKYQLQPGANKSASHLYVYSQPTDYLMYQQAQQQHPISATASGLYAQAQQTSEPGQQQQQYYAQAQVDPYGAGGKVTTQQQQQQSDHWKPVDFASPAAYTAPTAAVNFYPLKSGAGQQQQAAGPAPQQSKSALLNGYSGSGQPDHDIVSLSARQQQQQQRALYSANSSAQLLAPTATQQQQLMLGYGGSTSNASTPLLLVDSEHAHLGGSGGNYRPMAYVNSQAAVELAPSQQVHAHPSFSSQAGAQYNGTGSQISSSHNSVASEAYQPSSSSGQQQQIGVTNEYASLPTLPSYTSKRYKQQASGEQQTSEEAPKIPRAHSSLTSSATGGSYRRPSDTTTGSSYVQQHEVEAVEQQDDSSGYDSAEPADYTKPTLAVATGAKGPKYAGGQKSPAARPQKGRPVKKQQVKVAKQTSEEILQQYAEPEQLSLQQAAHQQQVASDLNGASQQELVYGQQQQPPQQHTRQPGRPYMSAAADAYAASGVASAPSYGNLMMRPGATPGYYRPAQQQQQQQQAPSKGLLSWETITSVASGAAKRIPGALSSLLSPFKYQQQQHSIYPTANYGANPPPPPPQYPKSAHYAGDVANFHRPYPFRHMSHPQSYSDSTPHGAADPSDHQHQASADVSGEESGGEEASGDGETDLSGASSSSSSSEQSSGDSHTLNVTSHAYPPSSGGINGTEIVGDLAEISLDGVRPPSGAAKRRPIHGASSGSKSKGAGPKQRPPAGSKQPPAEPKELDPAQVAVLSSIEHQLATEQQPHKGGHAANKGGGKRKSGNKKTRPPVMLSSLEDDATKTTPPLNLDPTILAAHSSGPIHLDSLPPDQQRLLLGKMAGAHSGLASYMKQATPPGGVMFPSPEAAASGLGSGPLSAHMMASGGGGGPSPPGGPQLNAVQIGQYKIVPQTQFVQSIIEPSRQMLGQYFRQYLGQLNQFAAG